MSRRRKGFVVYITLIANTLIHNEDSALAKLREVLEERIAEHNPTIAHAPYSIAGEQPRRKAFVIYVDLDGGDGTWGKMYSNSTGRQHLRYILRDTVLPHNPIITLAPAPLQPDYIAEGSTEA
jgi:hypothetical protein